MSYVAIYSKIIKEKRKKIRQDQYIHCMRTFQKLKMEGENKTFTVG